MAKVRCLNIDWLEVYCLEPCLHDANYFRALGYDVVSRNYGTPLYEQMFTILQEDWPYIEIRRKPHQQNQLGERTILANNACHIRFANRTCYLPGCVNLLRSFLVAHGYQFVSISRIDICADFNQFKTMSAEELIAGFAAKKYRHVGQGVGALYFNHGILTDKMTKKRAYGVNYTGLSFGTHGSDFRTYLYNKSFELLTQGDKPWIRDRWRNVGLDVQNVWRLEVSIKSAACKFKDRITGQIVPIDKNAAADDDELGKIFHTFVRKKFAFVRNHPKITNISREPRLELFDLHPIYDHRTIRNKSAGKRFEKMFIKALYLLGDLYRGHDIHDESLTAQSLAFDIAHSTDLSRWMSEKIPTWEKPTHK